MTNATIEKFPEKIYEIDFQPITLTSPMRKMLFEFFQISAFLAQQSEAFALENNLSPSYPIILNAVNNFNNIKNKVEDFITSNV